MAACDAGNEVWDGACVRCTEVVHESSFASQPSEAASRHYLRLLCFYAFGSRHQAKTEKWNKKKLARTLPATLQRKAVSHGAILLAIFTITGTGTCSASARTNFCSFLYVWNCESRYKRNERTVGADKRKQCAIFVLLVKKKGLLLSDKVIFESTPAKNLCKVLTEKAGCLFPLNFLSQRKDFF